MKKLLALVLALVMTLGLATVGANAATSYADEDDITAGYNTLLHELEEYNPELLDKQRVLAVTKKDLIDKEIEAEIEPCLPKGIPHIFISSVTGEGLKELKDLLWTALQS